jgi:hypothetical protein
VSQNFLLPQRDQPLLMPVDMREWLPEDDLVFVVLDAVARRAVERSAGAGFEGAAEVRGRSEGAARTATATGRLSAARREP